jgi:hypothetical protein
MRRLLALFAWCSVAGCSDLGFDLRSLTDLEEAAERWEDGRAAWTAGYFYAIERMCYCPVESMGPVHVDVTTHSVQRTYVGSGDPVPPSMEHLFPTVEALFDILRDAYADEAHEVRVTYDPALGYPVDFWIDYDEMTADEELGMRVVQAPFPFARLPTSASPK